MTHADRPDRIGSRTFVRRSIAIMVSALTMTLALGGCASVPEGPATFDVPAGRYAEAFDHTREALLRSRFSLDRVDARTGVISTQAKSTVGLATPWDTEQSTLAQSWEDFANQQRRVVRVTFEPADPPEPDGRDTLPPDLREAAGPLVARVEVVLYRVNRPGWRVSTAAPTRSSRSIDPALRGRGMAPNYEVPIARDDLLAARIAADLRETIARARSLDG